MTAHVTSGPIRDTLERDLVRGTSDLPTLPRGVAEALRLARKATPDFTEIESVANGYPPLAARLLAVANSARYSGGARIASVRRAAIRLGTQTTRDVLYQVAYATMFVDAPRFRERIETSFEHGVRAARFGRLVAVCTGLDPDVAFLVGLMHDIGRARCWKLVASMRGEIEVADAEAAVDELHAEAGAELTAAWHLPAEVVEACRWHHEPQDRTYPRLAVAAAALAVVEGTGRGQDEARAALADAAVGPGDIERLLATATEGSAAREPSGVDAHTSGVRCSSKG